MPFSASFPIDFNGFTAAGFQPVPASGQLDSDFWRIQGFSDNAGLLDYSATITTASDYARGILAGDPTIAGLYAANTGLAGVGTAFVIQPTGAEFGTTPGTITLRVQYTGTTSLSAFTFDYDGIYRNNADRSVAVNLAYAVAATDTQPTSFSDNIAGLGFTTPLALTAGANWSQLDLTAQTINATVNPNDYIFLRWQIGDNGGTGSRDEVGDGAGNWNNQRLLATQALDAFLKTNPTGINDPDKIIMGDFNSYAQELSMKNLTNSGYSNLIQDFIGNDKAASYVFDGQKGYLDAAFSSQSLKPYIRTVDEWRLNSPEADGIDYNTDFSRPTNIFDGTMPNRYSDHDPVVVNLKLDPALLLSRGGATVDVGDNIANLSLGAQAGDIITIRKPAGINDGPSATIKHSDVTIDAPGGYNGVFVLADGQTNLGSKGLGNITLNGNSGANILTGNSGDNQFTGGAGDDTMNGGTGNDTASFFRQPGPVPLRRARRGTHHQRPRRPRPSGQCGVREVRHRRRHLHGLIEEHHSRPGPRAGQPQWQRQLRTAGPLYRPGGRAAEPVPGQWPNGNRPGHRQGRRHQCPGRR